MNYVYVRKERHFYECLVTYLRKSTHQDQKTIYCQTVHVFGQFSYVLVCKNVCQASLSSFLLLAIFCLDQCQMKIACLASLSLVGDNSLAHKLTVMAAVKLHLNATYAQHLALKSIYEKRQCIMGGKLFSCRIMFE